MLVDLISRAACFDPARGCWGAFVTVVTRNAARSILAHRTGVIAVSAEIETFADDTHVQAETACAMKLDTMALLHRLPPSLLPILMGVGKEGGVTDAQRASGMPAASFYRALRQLRLRRSPAGSHLSPTSTTAALWLLTGETSHVQSLRRL